MTGKAKVRTDSVESMYKQDSGNSFGWARFQMKHAFETGREIQFPASWERNIKVGKFVFLLGGYLCYTALIFSKTCFPMRMTVLNKIIEKA